MTCRRRLLLLLAVVLAAIIVLIPRVPSAQAPLSTKPADLRESDTQRRHLAAIQDEVERVRAGESTRWVVAGDDWVPIGPFGLTTTGIEGLVNGRSYHVVTNPLNSAILSAIPEYGGVLSTLDGGRSWRWYADAQREGYARGFHRPWVYDPAFPGVVYASVPASHGSAVVRSDDDGVTWKTIWTPPDQSVSIGPMVADPVRTLGGQTRLLVNASGGVWEVSADGRVSRRLLNVSTALDDLTVNRRAPNYVFAMSATGVFLKSGDGGYSWTASLLPADLRGPIAVGAGDAPRLYLASALAGFCRSDDLGRTWTCRQGFVSSGGEGEVAVIADPTAPDTVYLGGSSLARSTDAGQSWTQASSIGGITSLAFDAEQRIVVATTSGLFRLQSNTLTPLNSGYSAFDVWSVAAAGDLPAVFGSTWPVSLFAMRGVSGWAALQTGSWLKLAVDESGRVLYAGPSSSRPWTLYRRDLSTPWATADSLDLAARGVTSPESTPVLALGPPGTATLYLLADDLYVSPDRGETWSKVASYQSPRSRRGPDGRIYPFAYWYGTSLAVSPSSPGTMYAGTCEGQILATTDGSRWVLSSWTLPLTHVSALAVHPRDGRVAYAGFWGYPGQSRTVFRTTDAGVTWVDITANLPVATVNAIAIDPDGPGITVYAATDAGVFRLPEGSDVWQLFGRNLPAVAVRSLVYHAASDTLIAGTRGRGIFAISSRFTR
jgi:photosystem II stability/assembly factor-like uncharacterized protein